MTAREDAAPDLGFNFFTGPYGDDVIASFPDPDPIDDRRNDLVMIDWGDHTPSTVAEVDAAPDGSNNIVIQGRHTYEKVGFDQINLTLTNTQTGDISKASEGLYVPDAPLQYLAEAIGIPPSGLYINQMIAEFGPDTQTDPSDYTVVINWGDGQSSPGIVTRIAPKGIYGFNFLVTGSHTFPTSKTENQVFPGSIEIEDDGGSTVTMPLNFHLDHQAN